MNAVIRKEIRLLMPAWSVALLLAVVPMSFVSANYFTGISGPAAGIATFCFGLGMVILNLSSFGQEFNAGTFSSLLAQPLPRERIWAIKSLLLAGAVMVVLLVQVLVYCWRAPAIPSLEVLLELFAVWGVIGLTFYSGALWTSLLLRQVTAAFWFTLFIPAGLVVGIGELVERYSGQHPEAIIWVALTAYSIAGWLWARWLFLRAQDAQWTGGVVSLPTWFRAKSPTEQSASPPRRKPLRALVAKEFQSHLVSLLLGGVLLLLHIAALVARAMQAPQSRPNSILYHLLDYWWVLCFALPLLVGGTTVAEERKLGTWESQLCLPARRGAQFTIKLAFALLLGVWLGGVMPWVIESIGSLAGVPGEFPNLTAPSFWAGLGVFCLISAGLTLVSFYASTLTRNLLQALGAAVFIGLDLAAIGAWAVTQSSMTSPLWAGPLVIYLGVPSILGVLLWLAFNNFNRLQIGSAIWLRNLLTLVVTLMGIAAATALVWNRAWELVVTEEPRHGPAQLAGPIQPRICSTGIPFVLLPDGRLWVATRFELQELSIYETYRDPDGRQERKKSRIPVPVDGSFIGGTNWIDVVGTFHEVAGLQSDGSLWRIFYADRRAFFNGPGADLSLERVGADSDWKMAAAGPDYFLGLKQDGTLWGWGNVNWTGFFSRHSLGERTRPGELLTTVPQRIGPDSDWSAVFASVSARVCSGIKRDGSVWKWGFINSPAYQPRDVAEPERWPLDGTGWRSLASNGRLDLAVKQNGTLWASGWIPRDMGNLLGGRRGESFAAKPVQVGRDSDWSDVTLGWSLMVGLKTNGTLVEEFMNGRRPLFWRAFRSPSRYSDWIAATAEEHGAGLVALAADGTLCAWEHPRDRFQESADETPLLGPTRKPLWSINILAGTK